MNKPFQVAWSSSNSKDKDWKTCPTRLRLPQKDSPGTEKNLAEMDTLGLLHKSQLGEGYQNNGEHNDKTVIGRALKQLD